MTGVTNADLLSALETMGVYLPDLDGIDAKVAALIGALEQVQLQVKTEKDKKEAADLAAAKEKQKIAEVEDKMMRIKMKADELIMADDTLAVTDAMLTATQILKDEELTAEMI